MAGTRRSTRQAATAVTNYNDDSSENEKATRNSRKTTRQKRVREEEAREDVGENEFVLNLDPLYEFILISCQ